VRQGLQRRSLRASHLQEGPFEFYSEVCILPAAPVGLTSLFKTSFPPRAGCPLYRVLSSTTRCDRRGVSLSRALVIVIRPPDPEDRIRELCDRATDDPDELSTLPLRWEDELAPNLSLCVES
jgi:hypothetical protein